MVRYSEVVLPGHPDKLCDAAAEAIVQAALAVDPDAYAQVEASVWDYEMWLTGGVVTSRRVPRPFADIAKEPSSRSATRPRTPMMPGSSRCAAPCA